MNNTDYASSQKLTDRNLSRSSGTACQDIPDPRQPKQPTEKSLTGCALELRDYLFELGKLHSEMRCTAFLPEPCDIEPTAAGLHADCLEGVLRHSCRMAACLVGEARTINAKLLG